MLMQMKAYVEGMRSFLYYVALCIDRRNSAPSEDEQIYYNGLVELLTPVVKAYGSERGLTVCDQAVQVFGGYGYTKEYPVEQLLRDCKITTIYEGTNGIQAMDLLGRKMGLQSGAVFLNFIGEIEKTIETADDDEMVSHLAAPVKAAVIRLVEVARQLAESAQPSLPTFKTAFAHAHPFYGNHGGCRPWPGCTFGGRQWLRRNWSKRPAAGPRKTSPPCRGQQGSRLLRRSVEDRRILHPHPAAGHHGQARCHLRRLRQCGSDA